MKERNLEPGESLNDLGSVFLFEYGDPGYQFKGLDMALAKFDLELVVLNNGTSDYWLQIVPRTA